MGGYPLGSESGCCCVCRMRHLCKNVYVHLSMCVFGVILTFQGGKQTVEKQDSRGRWPHAVPENVMQTAETATPAAENKLTDQMWIFCRS